MVNILSLDVGDRRVGIAFGTSSPKSAKPLLTVVRDGGKAEQVIIKLISDHEVDLMVVGMPLNEDGTRSEQCAKIERFANRIMKRCSVEVVYVDEYASSYEAAEIIGLKGRPDKKQRDMLDAVSARLILVRYLENNGL